MVAGHLALTSAADIWHRTDEEFGWSKPRIASLNQHDLLVMNNQKPLARLEKPFVDAREIHCNFLAINYRLLKMMLS